jgi:hypothetical protein
MAWGVQKSARGSALSTNPPIHRMRIGPDARKRHPLFRQAPKTSVPTSDTERQGGKLFAPLAPMRSKWMHPIHFRVPGPSGRAAAPNGKRVKAKKATRGRFGVEHWCRTTYSRQGGDPTQMFAHALTIRAEVALLRRRSRVRSPFAPGRRSYADVRVCAHHLRRGGAPTG